MLHPSRSLRQTDRSSPDRAVLPRRLLALQDHQSLRQPGAMNSEKPEWRLVFHELPGLSIYFYLRLPLALASEA
jgi:hypothetical protein